VPAAEATSSTRQAGASTPQRLASKKKDQERLRREKLMQRKIDMATEMLGRTWG